MDNPVTYNNRFPGYGMFWVVNSINSTILLSRNHDFQSQIAADNEAFQLEMENAREIAQNEIEAEKIAYKRRMLALSRKWHLEESAKSHENQIRAIELQAFLRNWPLDLQPYTILKQVKSLSASPSELVPLNVILLRTPLITGTAGQIINRESYIIKEESNIYKNIEYSIKYYDEPIIGNINFRRDACSKICEGNSDIMNIHYLMSSIPTLVIAPRYQDGRLYFTAGAWDSLSTRPIIRPLLNMAYDIALAYENSFYRKEMIDKLHYTISIIIGVIRDSYAILTYGKTSTLNSLLNTNFKIRQFVDSEAGIKAFLNSEITGLLAALDSNNVTNLREVYHERDIDQMKSLVLNSLEVF